MNEPYNGFFRDVRHTNIRYAQYVINYDQRAHEMCSYLSMVENVGIEEAMHYARVYCVEKEWLTFKRNIC